MDLMEDIRNAKVVDFGKITHPRLPEMTIVVFERGYGYQAVCINILLDSTGKSKEDACKNLTHTIMSYVRQAIHNCCGDEKTAIKELVHAALDDENELKAMYYAKYRQAKNEDMARKLALKMKAPEASFFQANVQYTTARRTRAGRRASQASTSGAQEPAVAASVL